jgi:hypothetical protein
MTGSARHPLFFHVGLIYPIFFNSWSSVAHLHIEQAGGRLCSSSLFLSISSKLFLSISYHGGVKDCGRVDCGRVAGLVWLALRLFLDFSPRPFTASTPKHAADLGDAVGGDVCNVCHDLEDQNGVRGIKNNTSMQ